MNYKALLKKAKRANKIDYLNRSKYLLYYQTLAIKENVIVMESQHGRNLNGNIFYLAKKASSSDLTQEEIERLVGNALKRAGMLE